MDYGYDGYEGNTGYSYELQGFGEQENLINDQIVADSFIAAFFAFLAAYFIVLIAVAVVMIIAEWKIFTKANKPGWAAIIPIYSNWVLFEAVGMSGWYVLLALIPVVGGIIYLVFYIMACIKLAKCFGKESGFTVGLILLPVVFFPILGFGKATYTAPVVENQTSAA